MTPSEQQWEPGPGPRELAIARDLLTEWMISPPENFRLDQDGGRLTIGRTTFVATDETDAEGKVIFVLSPGS